MNLLYRDSGSGVAAKRSRAMNKAIDVAADLDTPSDLSVAAMNRISAALNNILADTFALYLKTKNFHWHVSG
jgi:starvation-inducible DNA-binding protein